jgi:hypothetical protein
VNIAALISELQLCSPHFIVVNEKHRLPNDRRDRPLVASRQAIEKPRRNTLEDNFRPWSRLLCLLLIPVVYFPLRPTSRDDARRKQLGQMRCQLITDGPPPLVGCSGG